MTYLIFQILLRVSLISTAITGFTLVSLKIEEPVLKRIPDFAVCDFPCWAGITPLETPFEQVPQVLNSHLLVRGLNFRSNLSQISFTTTLGTPQIYGLVYGERERVSAMRLDLSLPFWMFIEVLGSPTCARVTRLSDVAREAVTLYWETPTHTIFAVTVVDGEQNWGPEAPIRYLFIGEYSNDCYLLNAARWQGFAHLWYYRVG